MSLCIIISADMLTAKTIDPSLHDMYENSIPFEFIITDNDDTTATLVCFMPTDGMYELIMVKNGRNDYQLITDDTPFIVDTGYEYTVCFKLYDNGNLYCYDGYIFVEINQNGAVLKSSDFLTSILYEYDSPSEFIDINLPDNIPDSESAAAAKLPQAAPPAPTVSSFTATSVTLKALAGCEYAKSANGPWQTNTAFSGLTAGTTYSFYQRRAATNTHNASPASPAKKQTTSTKAPQSAPAAPTVASFTATSVTLKAVAGCEYAMTIIGPWRTNPTFSGLTAGTTYSFYQRRAATNTHNASPASLARQQKTASKAPQLAPAAPTIASFTATNVTLRAVAGCEYARSANGPWQTVTTFTGLIANTTYNFYQRRAATPTHNASPASSARQQKTLPKPPLSAPAAPSISRYTANSVTLNAVSGCEYAMSASGPWQKSTVFSGLRSKTTYSFYQRRAATSTNSASPASPAKQQKTL